MGHSLVRERLRLGPLPESVFRWRKSSRLHGKTKTQATQTEIWMHREDGTEILRGTASAGSNNPPSELEQRLAQLETPESLVILRDVRVGMKTTRKRVRMERGSAHGRTHPFSLNAKLRVITEPSPWYTAEGAQASPWKRATIPMEMISVLVNYAKDADAFPVRGPTVGLFARSRDPSDEGPSLRRRDVRDRS